MVRAVLRNGVFVPLDPIPAEWTEGAPLQVERSSDGNLDGDAWLEEMNRLCADSTPEADAAVQQVLNEQRELGKQIMRRPMGLDP
ncbi:MAG: hypothetical protein K2X38_14035 [Gemmataceae bacterium]|nr:hypothetical protein [Gemmataceae bacterium]